MEIKDGTYFSTLWFVNGTLNGQPLNLTFKLYRRKGEGWTVERIIRVIVDDEVWPTSQDPKVDDVFLAKRPDLTEEEAIESCERWVRAGMAKMDESTTVTMVPFRTDNPATIIDIYNAQDFAHVTIINDNPNKEGKVN